MTQITTVRRHPVRPKAGRARRALAMLAAAAVLGSPLHSYGLEIDGTTGSNTNSTPLSTTGNLSVSLGFFVDYLLIGGGGGGGSNTGGGGGGGGIQNGSTSVNATSYPVVVGVGGTGGSSGGNGTNGGNSTAFSITANGGGAWQSGLRNGGASGAPQAKAGGWGWTNTPGSDGAAGGGGGGAGLAGVNGSTSSVGGAGGMGLANSITGSKVTYSGGGGGGNEYLNSGPGGGGGAGGGGNGGQGFNDARKNGGAGTVAGGGGGGGGAYSGPGGNGAAGLAVVRYLSSSPALGTGVTGGTKTTGTGTATGYTLHTISTVGTSTLNFSGLNLNNLGATQTGVISGGGNLNYNGPGKLTLNNTNTYVGATNITAGTIAIGSSGSISSSSGVNISSGATFDVLANSGFTIGASQTLTGAGTVMGAIAIAGTHNPGASPGTQTFDNDLTYNTGANVGWELIANSSGSPGTNYDQIILNSAANLNFSGSTTLNLTFNGAGSTVDWSNAFWNVDRSWMVWDLSSGTTSNLSNLSINTQNWLDGLGASFNTARPNGAFSVSLVGQDVFVNYVPEPSTWILGTIAAGTMGYMARKRRLAARQAGA